MDEQTQSIGEAAMELSDSVKLVKNTKGFNWEIKLRGSPVFGDEELKRLNELNDKLEQKYGKTE